MLDRPELLDRVTRTSSSIRDLARAGASRGEGAAPALDALSGALELLRKLDRRAALDPSVASQINELVEATPSGALAKEWAAWQVPDLGVAGYFVRSGR